MAHAIQARALLFASFDALRGLTVAVMLLVNTPGDWSHVYAPLLHAEWHGVTPTDLVFPFFLFIVGVSIALGVVPRAEAGVASPALVRAVLWRAAQIVALGLALHLLAYLLLDRPSFRPWGVLQRIGLCFAIAGLLALYLKPRPQWALIVALLLGYWALMAPWGYDPYTNLAARVDTTLFGPWLYQWDAAAMRGQDPEGLLSTLHAVATALLGVRAGSALRAGALRTIGGTGVAMVVLGLAWSPLFPLNKALWTSSCVPPEQRNIGFVFQDFALFPDLTVMENVQFGLTRLARQEARRRAGDMLDLVRMPDAGDKYPHELSGGQRQRVALARALAPQPSFMLLDEPFSNLDVDLRERLSLEVRDILKREGSTAILVTHDQHEAFAMADEIGVMHQGKIQQWDTPYNLYHRPANRFVADFVGQGVFLPAKVVDDRHVEIEFGQLESAIPIACSMGCGACPRRFSQQGCAVEVLVRPDDLVHDDQSDMQARVLNKAFRGADILYTLELASGARVLSLVPSHHNHALGEMIGIRLDIDHVVAFKREEGQPEIAFLPA